MAEEKMEQIEFKATKDREGELCMGCFQTKPLSGGCPNCDD